MGLNLYQSGPIYADMLQYARYPGGAVHRIAGDARRRLRDGDRSARTGR